MRDIAIILQAMLVCLVCADMGIGYWHIAKDERELLSDENYSMSHKVWVHIDKIIIEDDGHSFEGIPELIRFVTKFTSKVGKFEEGQVISLWYKFENKASDHTEEFNFSYTVADHGKNFVEMK